MTEGKQLQECQGLFLLLVGPDIHDHKPGLAILGDDQRLTGLGKGGDDFGRVALEVTDGFDLG